jgi:hypothetical protein
MGPKLDLVARNTYEFFAEEIYLISDNREINKETGL